MSSTSYYFGDTTAALAQLRLAFDQLDACSPTKGAVTSQLMAHIFCEASRSPYSSVRRLYENPSDEDSACTIDMSSDAVAADLVSKALAERLQEKSDVMQ